MSSGERTDLETSDQSEAELQLHTQCLLDMFPPKILSEMNERNTTLTRLSERLLRRIHEVSAEQRRRN